MKYLLLVALAAALAGCTSTGVQVKDEQLSSFTPGQTTKQEVISALGQPTTQMRNADGSSTVVYMYLESRVRGASFIPIVGIFAGGADSRTSQVTLSFDSDGKLVSHSSSESAYGSGYGGSSLDPQPVADQPRKQVH